MNEDEQIYSDAVIRAVDSGHKVLAIRILREETGLGLAEAKAIVEQLERERSGLAPVEAPMTESGGAGSMIKLLVAILVIVFIYLFFFPGG